MDLGPDASSVFFDAGSRYALLRAFDAPLGAPARSPGSRRLTGLEARWVLARILGPGAGPEIARLYRTLLRGPLPIFDDADVHRLREALLDAVEQGHLVVFEATLAGGAVDGDVAEEEPPASAPAPREEKTWIGIVLMDDEDPPRPVAFATYRIELPDGSRREGMLDEHGRARLEGLDPGTCQVSFPDFDSRDWS